MNDTHPTILQALTPYMPRPYPQPPPCPRGMVAYDFRVSEFLTLTCHLEYQELEIGAREHGTGLQLEPDFPASMTLVSAYVRDKDVFDDLLTKAQIARIEELALAMVWS